MGPTHSRFVPLLAIALAASCSSIPLDQRMQADRTRYESYAGPPIDHFLWMFRSRDNGWNALSPTELVVWTSPFEVYLIKVAEPCEDLTFARRIELTTTTLANTVAVHVDFVKVGRFRCPITEIRPVDEKRMKADERNQAIQPK